MDTILPSFVRHDIKRLVESAREDITTYPDCIIDNGRLMGGIGYLFLPPQDLDLEHPVQQVEQVSCLDWRSKYYFEPGKIMRPISYACAQ